MNSKQLVTAALAGQSVPRVPVGPMAVHFCAGVAGYTLRQYSCDARRLADSVLRYYERFRPDAIWLSADTWVSAQAMGATVGSPDPDQPWGGLGPPIVQTPADIDRLPLPDIGAQGRYPMMLDALRRVVSELGREVFIVACFDQYPFSLAAALMGINEIMLRLHDDPAFVLALMERCEEYALAYATALANQGADLLSGGDAPAGLLGASLYQRIAQPAEARLIAQLRTRTSKPISLHICGKATSLLPAMAATGASVLEVDQCVSLAQACATVGSHVALWGNLDPVAVLAQGTPDEVRTAATAALQTVRAAQHSRFVLSSGCTLAMETPQANLDALMQCSGMTSDGGVAG